MITVDLAKGVKISLILSRQVFRQGITGVRILKVFL
jgi:hypothetical protein